MSLNNRYHNRMSSAFSDQNILNAWRDVEVAVLMAKAALKKNHEFEVAANELNQIGDVDVARKEQIEKETKHDLVAAIRAMAEQVDDGNPDKNLGRLIHQGITSYDTEDTAQSLMLYAAGNKTEKRLHELLEALMAKANLFKYVPCNGYTHNQIAEPITVGKRFLDAAVGIDQQMQKLRIETKEANICKIKGATGIFSGLLTPELEKEVAATLHQTPARIATQILPIEDLLSFFNPMLIVACKIENLAQNLRLASGDLAEVKEGFAKGQTGSSVMTFKQNPINIENITGAARKIKALYNELMHATATWRERDISNSFQVQRHIIPEMFETMEHIISKTLSILSGLQVFPIQCMRNLKKYGDFVFAGAAKDFIATNFSDADNKKIYQMVQTFSIQAKNSADWRGEPRSLFYMLAPEVEKIGGKKLVEELKTAMSLAHNLRNIHNVYVDARFKNGREDTVHAELVDYMISGGQLKEFKPMDSVIFINSYYQIVEANYRNFGLKDEYLDKLKKSVLRFKKELGVGR